MLLSLSSQNRAVHRFLEIISIESLKYVFHVHTVSRQKISLHRILYAEGGGKKWC